MLAEIKKIFGVTILSTLFSALFLLFSSYFISKENLGLYQAFISFVILFSSFSTLRLELALPIISKKERKLLLNWLLFFVFIASLVVFILFQEPILIFGGVLYSLYLIYEMLLTSVGDISRLARIKLINALSFLIIVICFTLVFGDSYLTLCLSYMSALLLSFFFVRPSSDFFRHFSLRIDQHLLSKIKPFLFYSFPQNFANNFGAQLPVVYFTYLGNFSFLGIYYISNKVLDVSLGVISKSINQVFYHFNNKAYSNGCVEKAKKNFDYVVVPLVLGSVFIYILTYILKGIFDSHGNLIPEGISEVVTVCFIILPWKLSKMVTSSVATTFIVIGKQHVALLITVAFLPIRIGGLIFGENVSEKLLYFSLLSLLYYTVYLFVCRMLMVRSNYV
ncbi:lipopolysaccharide biosynthesis protein [Vibrio crassostreae]|uniref:lipopolysaccharide biosynthesis protein n=1 Tax=Vibrio crassostreae TaxID=246167 RepID=UPI001B316CE5|nr:hypothetical protein [Vibrio crassostreae]CAK3061764.1 membrane hypothetical protein [Vibrio crassostreae]